VKHGSALLILFTLCELLCHAAFADNSYVQDVRRERVESFYEVNLTALAPLKADLRSVVFNAQLTQEFREKYVARFGFIDTQSLAYTAVRFSDLNENRGISSTATDTLAQRRQFGEYMVRRLGEWHVDNFFKSDPSVRPLYEAKERLSNVSVKVGKETQAKITYSLSDNSIEVNVENPYCDAKMRIEMDPKSFGPSPAQENKFIAGKQLGSKDYLKTQVRQKDGTADLEWQMRHNAKVGSSYKISSPFSSQGSSPREKTIGAALAISF
jgi:hypothetical protein